MGIFGLTFPRFQYLPDADPAVAVVSLTYGLIVRSEPMPEYVEQKSQIDSAREFIHRGTHWVVEIKYHLYKHTTAPTPTERYTELVGYKGKEVYLWLHNDGSPFYTASSYTKALFCLKEVLPGFLTTTDYKDVLTLVFESVDTILQGSPV